MTGRLSRRGFWLCALLYLAASTLIGLLIAPAFPHDPADTAARGDTDASLALSDMAEGLVFDVALLAHPALAFVVVFLLIVAVAGLGCALALGDQPHTLSWLPNEATDALADARASLLGPSVRDGLVYYELLVFLTVMSVVASIVIFVISVRRCHDRGKSAQWLWLTLVPVFGGLWWLYELGLRRGNPDANRFGPPVTRDDGL